MSFILDLCDPDNPNGFCNRGSFLYYLWFTPIIIITIPIWFPIYICFIIYEKCGECQEWSRNKQLKKNEKEIINVKKPEETIKWSKENNIIDENNKTIYK